MAEIRVKRIEQSKIRNVPIAVTPDGFWCCPSPVALQKTLKAHNALKNPKSPSWPPKPSFHRKPISTAEKKIPPPAQSRTGVLDGRKNLTSDTTRPVTEVKTENTLPKNVAIVFGEPGTNDLKVLLRGKQGFCVKLNVHRNVLIENSSCFADRLSEQHAVVSSVIEISDCEDVEIYVETVGLMYCKDMKQRLIKQCVPRVLRILKVAEALGFRSCIDSCLEYLEAVPWVGEEEEEKVVSSVLRLQNKGMVLIPIPVLQRVSSDASNPPIDTLSQVLEFVLQSCDERGRREMKPVVLRLLKENQDFENHARTVHTSSQNCLHALLSLFKQAASEKPQTPYDNELTLKKQIALQADNLSWLLEILAGLHEADGFAVLWANQQELSVLHGELPVVSRYHVSLVTAKLFVVIGSGEALPLVDTRRSLLQIWLQPLISDYRWLEHGGMVMDQRAVEEGIGRTILTLPMEDQQSVMLSWLGSFLKAGEGCPNLQKAFEVWWRRTFVRPCTDSMRRVEIPSEEKFEDLSLV